MQNFHSAVGDVDVDVFVFVFVYVDVILSFHFPLIQKSDYRFQYLAYSFEEYVCEL